MSHYVYYAVLAIGVSLIATVIALQLLQRLYSRYRPERHYMRGPGPKWRQKQGHE